MKSIVAVLAFVACAYAAPGFLSGPAPVIYAAPVIKAVHPVHAVYSPSIYAAPVVHHKTISYAAPVFSHPVVKSYGHPLAFGGPYHGYGFGHGYGHGYAHHGFF